MSRQRLPLRLPLLSALVVLVVSAVSLSACNRGPAPDAAKKAAAAKTLLLSPEDLITLRASDQAQGPVITGTIQPEKRADLRAEVSAIVLQVLKENGEAVRQGDLLVRLDDTAIRDGLASSEESARRSARRSGWMEPVMTGPWAWSLAPTVRRSSGDSSSTGALAAAAAGGALPGLAAAAAGSCDLPQPARTAAASTMERESRDIGQGSLMRINRVSV